MKFKEIALYELRSALNSAQQQGIKLSQHQFCHHTFWKNDLGNIVLRIYKHKKSEQCLIVDYMTGHLPVKINRNSSKESSIYSL